MCENPRRWDRPQRRQVALDRAAHWPTRVATALYHRPRPKNRTENSSEIPSWRPQWTSDIASLQDEKILIIFHCLSVLTYPSSHLCTCWAVRWADGAATDWSSDSNWIPLRRRLQDASRNRRPAGNSCLVAACAGAAAALAVAAALAFASNGIFCCVVALLWFFAEFLQFLFYKFM